MSSPLNRLLDLTAGLELFCTVDGHAYATLRVKNHYETWPIRSRGFKNFLINGYFRQYGTAPRDQAVRLVGDTLTARAICDGPQRQVFLRVAEDEHRVYIDLGDPEWRVVEIDREGWRIVAHSPVKFRRPPGMCALPIPELGGSINELRTFVNVASETDFNAIIGCTLGAMRARGPYAILCLSGEQGTSKTTVARIYRALLDPAAPDVRAKPRDVQDLMIAAHNEYILAFDNLSHLPGWLSDALCRLSTGGGFRTRQLYSDLDETIIDVQRPVVLTGIGEVATRSDLLDRCIVVELPPIRPDRRRPEAEFWQNFRIAHGRIFGALLDAVAAARKNFPFQELENLPRMADFVAWVAAAESQFGWLPGTFAAAYDQNRAAAHEMALEASPLVAPLVLLLERGSEWRGTATKLLTAINHLGGDSTPKGRGWPKNAQALSVMLRTIAPDLRAIGIEVEHERTSDHTRERIIRLRASDASDASDSAKRRVLADSTEPNITEEAGADFNRVANDLDHKLEVIAEKAQKAGQLNAATAAFRERRKLAEFKFKNQARTTTTTTSDCTQFENVRDEELEDFIKRGITDFENRPK